jgi:alkylated DNA nucleotide flippase Atl1
MLLPTRSEQVYGDYWLPMQRALGADLELLIWLDELLNGNDKVKQTEVYRAEAGRLERLGGDEDRIAEWVVALSRRSALLRLALDPSGEPDPDVRAALRRLNDWGGQASYPATMLLLERRAHGRLDSATVARSLLTIKSFLVRRMIAGVPTNDINRILNAVPREIARDEDSVSALQAYLSGTRRFWPRRRHPGGGADPAVLLVRSGPAAVLRPAAHRGELQSRGAGGLRAREADHRAPHAAEAHRRPAGRPRHGRDGGRHDGRRAARVAGAHPRQPDAERAERAARQSSVREEEGDPAEGLAGDERRNHRRGPVGHRRDPRRADRLADRIIRLWPGPLQAGSASRSRDWSRLHQALAMLPAGSWTTYGDLAELVGSAAQPIGNHLANEVVQNAWRVLTSDGRPSRQFRWPDGERTGTQQEVLEEEGVTFDPAGRASTEQRMSAADLAVLIGLEVPADIPTGGSRPDDPGLGFTQQLGSAQTAATAGGVHALLDAWRGSAATSGTATRRRPAPFRCSLARAARRSGRSPSTR